MFSSQRIKIGLSSCLFALPDSQSIKSGIGLCMWFKDRMSGSIELALAVLCSRQDYMDAERAKGRNFDDIYSEVSQSGLLPVVYSGQLPLLCCFALVRGCGLSVFCFRQGYPCRHLWDLRICFWDLEARQLWYLVLLSLLHGDES